MFKKLGTHDLTISEEDYGDKVDSYTKDFDGVERGSHYYEFADQDYEKAFIERFLPEELVGFFDAKIMVLDYPNIPPHVDNGSKVTINMYVETAGATTTFYSDDPKSADIAERLENQSDGGALFDASTLNVDSSFVAEKGDVYLLDISKIHSVDFADTEAKRVVIVIQSSSLSYDDVKDAAFNF